MLIYSVHVTIKEQLAVSLLRDGGVQSFELKGDLDLRITDAALAKLRLTLSPKDYADLQFKQHPNVAKFTGGEKVIGLKDSSRSFPVGQGLGVLRWRMTSKDESNVPLTGGLDVDELAKLSYRLATTSWRWNLGCCRRIRARSFTFVSTQRRHLHPHSRQLSPISHRRSRLASRT